MVALVLALSELVVQFIRPILTALQQHYCTTAVLVLVRCQKPKANNLVPIRVASRREDVFFGSLKLLWSTWVGSGTNEAPVILHSLNTVHTIAGPTIL